MEEGHPHDPLADHVIGYPKLAARITLNIRNLLYMQAELANLEIKLDKLTKQDDVSKETNKKRYATHYGYLDNSHKDGDQAQYALTMKIRLKLRDYNLSDHLPLQVSQMNTIVSPDEFDLHDVQKFLGSDEMGPLALEGEDAYFWGSHASPKGFKRDIVTLAPRHKEDAFSKWIAERAMTIIKCFGRFMKPSKDFGEVVIYDSSILKGTFWIESMVASMLSIASIVVLIHLQSQTARLGTIAAFNRIDCFAVTAA
ncbi:hypothetical protein T440DRAFT_541268 [Plenodomus tracheiphilus IPT5]|uniref:DUF6594 domain-containing protein n=1 Tax=Plenodomus tracheiphilus IPT5 TaxID=1408161 RepID=A0A6A7AU33_9PLEO|nr:hypothetical protein T440DRAFT_541268 [Plenodomus tracheiphilus IPT5]